MVMITFFDIDGAEQQVDVPAGRSVMEAAKLGDAAGIAADCGGSCSCATCHVHVDDAWADIVGGPNEMEESMLDFAEDRKPTSRLSCQIPVTEALDGLVVRVAQ